MWNGLFFMERVVGNYHVNAYKAKQLAKQTKQNAQSLPPMLQAAGGQAQQPPLSPDSKAVETAMGGAAGAAATHHHGGDAYESADHFTPGTLPFMGMRVSVSKDDLRQVEDKARRSSLPSRLPDAYPASLAKKAQ